ncbi:MAG: FlhC family transcriptional regulator [Pseudomonadota bacterium]
MAVNTTQAERHLRALSLAKDCAALGARIRTIGYVTGMAHTQLVDLFFADRNSSTRGRPPDSPDWYHSANLLNRTEASIFVSVYRRIRELGFGPADALVTAYKHYQTVCHDEPRISFDRAFDMASHMDGIWLVRTSSFSLVTCPVCASQYVTAVGSHATTNYECPFCKLVKRYRLDPRIQSSFRANALPDPTALSLGVLALTLQMRRG